MVDLEKVMPELNDKLRIDRGAHHQVIVSLTDTSSSTHFDDTDSVLHVMKGAKRIALAPACLKLELAQANGLKSFSSYDPFTDANVDRRVWKFVDMWEGGSLFLPKNMWHHVLSAAGTMALSINVEIVGEAGGGGKKRRSPKDRAALSKKRRTNDALEKPKKGGGGEEQEEEEEEEEQGGEIEFGDGDMGGGWRSSRSKTMVIAIMEIAIMAIATIAIAIAMTMTILFSCLAMIPWKRNRWRRRKFEETNAAKDALIDQQRADNDLMRKKIAEYEQEDSEEE